MADEQSLWRDRNKVFVAGIPSYVDDDALYEKFRRFGEMFQSKVVLDVRTGKSKGFGFLTFANYEHALEAVSQMNQAKWDTRVLNVRFLQPKGENGDANGDAAVRNRPAKVFGPCPPGCTTVYVGNLAYSITEPVLRKVFTSCGDIKAVRFADHIETKEFRGFGYVQFYDSAACEKAVRLDGMIVMGRPMNLDYGSRDEATEKAREELQRKLKKGICHKFQSGACPRGDECKFAHVLSAQNAEHVLHIAPTPSVSTVVDDSAPIDNGTPVCQSFLKGKCKRGDKCKFQHTDSPAAPVDTTTDYVPPMETDTEETPVCQSYLKGKCKRDDNCKFRHIDMEATPTLDETPEEVEDDTPVCQSYLKGKCKRGGKCKFRHVDGAVEPMVPQLSVAVCLSYQKGTCHRGESCRFRHVEVTPSEEPAEVVEDPTPATNATEAEDDAPICQNFIKGECKRGAKCRFRHVDGPDDAAALPAVVPTISICKNFQRGRCTRGSSCRFAHTADEAAVVAVETVTTAHSEYQKRFQSVCYNWQNSRTCIRGDACPFFHDGPSTETTSTELRDDDSAQRKKPKAKKRKVNDIDSDDEMKKKKKTKEKK